MDDIYTVEWGCSEGNAWYEIMGCFQDANLYQALAYDKVRYGARGVAHMILKRGNEVVAAAQARVQRVPGTRAGLAYVLWGPMWRRTGGSEDEETFRLALRILRSELSLKRGFVLRLNLLAFKGHHDVLRQALASEGYHSHGDARNRRTILVDLSGSLEELRTAQHPMWRNHLNRAEKKGLQVEFGEDQSLFDEIIPMYMEMAKRKGLSDLNDISHLKKVQKELPASHKLKVIVCRENGVPCAGGIFSALGTTGLYLTGATGTRGMKSYGAYIVHWTFLRWLKENGFLYYDLNGINPEVNPGTYQFKRQFAGKAGMEVEMLGKFEVADSALSSLVVRGGERLIDGYRKLSRRTRRR
ncbi:MAG: lipid II:glycine glycyltransferase FemX [Syntrophobacteraceae bacterium]